MNDSIDTNIKRLQTQIATSLLPVLDADYPLSVKARMLYLLSKTHAPIVKDKVFRFFEAHPLEENAILALSEIGGEEAVPLLISRVKQKGARFRDVMADQLGRSKSREAYECLRELMGDDDRHVRFQAANGLFQIGGKDCALALCRYISDADEWISMSILRFLCIMKEHESIPYLAEQFTKDTDLRRKALMVSFLSRFRSVTLVNIFDEGIRGKDARLKANSIEAIGELELPEREIKSRLEPFLRDPNNRIRANAILALARAESEKVRAEIVNMVQSSDVQLRRSAAFILGVIPNTNNEELAGKLIGDISDDVRKRMVLSLKNFPESFVRQQVERTIIDKNRWIRKFSVEIAGRLPDFPHEVILRQLREELCYPNLVACMEFFGKHHNSDAGRLIKNRLKDKRIPVVAGAIRAFGSMFGLAGVQKIAQLVDYRNPDVLKHLAISYLSLGGLDMIDSIVQKASMTKKGAVIEPFFPSLEACLDLLASGAKMPKALQEAFVRMAAPPPEPVRPVYVPPVAPAAPIAPVTAPVPPGLSPQPAMQASPRVPAVPVAAKSVAKLPALFVQGVKTYNLGKYKKAQALFKKCLEKHPDMAKVHQYLGLIAYEMKELEPAKFHLERFLAGGGHDVKALMTLARTYKSLRDWPNAVRIYEGIKGGRKKLNPKLELKVSRELGHAYIFLGDFAKAKNTLEFVFKKDPTNFETNYHLAMSHFRLDNYMRAEALLIDIVRQVPEGDRLRQMAESMLDRIRESLGGMSDDGTRSSDSWSESAPEDSSDGEEKSADLDMAGDEAGGEYPTYDETGGPTVTDGQFTNGWSGDQTVDSSGEEASADPGQGVFDLSGGEATGLEFPEGDGDFVSTPSSESPFPDLLSPQFGADDELPAEPERVGAHDGFLDLSDLDLESLAQPNPKRKPSPLSEEPDLSAFDLPDSNSLSQPASGKLQPRPPKKPAMPKEPGDDDDDDDGGFSLPSL